MKLKTWLVRNNETPSTFARRLNTRSERVRRWCLPHGHPEHRTPRADMVPLIFAETGGAVGPGDWYDMRSAADSEAAA